MISFALFMANAMAQERSGLEQFYQNSGGHSAPQPVCVPTGENTGHHGSYDAEPAYAPSQVPTVNNRSAQDPCVPSSPASSDIKYFVVVDGLDDIIETNYPCNGYDAVFLEFRGEGYFLVTKSGNKIPVRVSCRDE